MGVNLSSLTASKPLGLSPEVADKIERLLGKKLPNDLVKLLDSVLGMDLQSNVVFTLNDEEQSPVSHFLTGEDIVDHLQEERLEETKHVGIPIAYDGGGGTIYLRHLNGFDVFFEDIAFCRDKVPLGVIANSLTDFLLGLRIDETPIREEDLEGATFWIDPEFEKELRELEEQTGQKIFLEPALKNDPSKPSTK